MAQLHHSSSSSSNSSRQRCAVYHGARSLLPALSASLPLRAQLQRRHGSALPCAPLPACQAAASAVIACAAPTARPQQPLACQTQHILHHSRRTGVIAQAVALPVGTDWSQVFAVVLGWGVLVGSCFRSIPQIAKIVQAGSAEGLSLTANVVELVCFTIMLAYNLRHGYAFSTYGEIVACWVQDVVLVALILRHLRASPATVGASCAGFALLCGVLFYPGLVPTSALSMLQLSTLFVMAFGSRVPQIWLNIKRGNAGMLSLATSALNVCGNIVRTYTTLVLTQDTLLLAGCVTQGALNGILLWQAWQTHVAGQRAAAEQDAAKQGPPPGEPETPPGTVTPAWRPQLA